MGDVFPQRRFDVHPPEKFDPDALIPIVVNEKYGAINGKGGIVIKPLFDGCEYIPSLKIARVKHEGKWGVMDQVGKWLVRPAFDSLGDFTSSGLTAAQKGELWGIINTRGEWVVEPQYMGVSDFTTNGLAWTRKGTEKEYKDIYIDENTMPVVTIEQVCDTEIVKNEDGNLIWPVGKTIAQICADQEALKRHTKAEKKKQEDIRAAMPTESTVSAPQRHSLKAHRPKPRSEPRPWVWRVCMATSPRRASGPFHPVLMLPTLLPKTEQPGYSSKVNTAASMLGANGSSSRIQKKTNMFSHAGTMVAIHAL